jgi:hypothetical protein
MIVNGTQAGIGSGEEGNQHKVLGFSGNKILWQ